MNSKNYKAISIVLFCTIFTSLGQIFFKMAAGKITSISSIFTNLPLFLGLLSYGIGSLLLIIALKYGELSIIYPFIALGFVWVNVMSIFIFQENVVFMEWLGITLIILGVSLIGYGSSKDLRKKWKN